jgi:2-aminoadipate transaminase
VPRSFLREILKAAAEPDTISFAGGLPSRELFPLEEIRHATNKVFDIAGADALQYANSEGFIGLREWIAQRYRDKHQLYINPEHILITSGSQQGLDLIGKTLLNDNDDVIIEEPGYLGAIQAFSLYNATFRPVPLHTNGIDIPALTTALSAHNPKVYYAVPNYQNPSGLTYDESNRQQVADLIQGTRTPTATCALWAIPKHPTSLRLTHQRLWPAHYPPISHGQRPRHPHRNHKIKLTVSDAIP